MDKTHSLQVSSTLSVNGEKRTVRFRFANTLLDVLRNQLGLIGQKPGCRNGDCGACTVGVNSQPIKSCLMFAFEAIDQEITTIEGLRETRIQQAFLENFAFQCGYCTPGFIINSHLLLKKHPNASEEIMKEWLESNICRCTGYQEIEQAVKSVISLLKKE